MKMLLKYLIHNRLVFILSGLSFLLGACDLINLSSENKEKNLDKLSVTGDIARRTDWFSFGWCETTEVISGQEYCEDNPNRFFVLPPEGFNFTTLDGHFVSEYRSNAKGTLEVHYDMKTTFNEEYKNHWIVIGWARALFSANEGVNFGKLIVDDKPQSEIIELELYTDSTSSPARVQVDSFWRQQKTYYDQKCMDIADVFIYLQLNHNNDTIYYKLKNDDHLYKNTLKGETVFEWIKEIALDTKEMSMKTDFYFLVDECDGYVNGGHWDYERE
ncbi:hypothetical protein [Sunxiuqinia indica]|uniref:hypothetical protein n=1 Tax=Sunxiuqinia indica TaxID=2692584 RepID=UPI00135B2B35|nr:hypothetical protein [Sunxiuqinia indica]